MERLPVYQIQKFNCEPNDNDFYVNDFKSHLQNHDFIEKPHSHNFYLIVLFTQGSGTHTVDFEHFQIQPNQLFFLKPGQVHSWELSADINGYIVFYSRPSYNLYFGQKTIESYSYYNALQNAPEMILTAVQTTAIKTYFEMLILESQKPGTRKTDKLLNLLDCLHIELERIYNTGSEHQLHSYNIRINELEMFLDQHFRQEKSPSFYAGKMHMTLKHLNRICKTTLGLTLTDFIYAKIILESKRLLSTQKFTIGEVAVLVGFDNDSYFTRVFKKYSGMTPQQFKKQLLV